MILKDSKQQGQAEDSIALFCSSLIEIRALSPKGFRRLQLKIMETLTEEEEEEESIDVDSMKKPTDPRNGGTPLLHHPIKSQIFIVLYSWKFVLIFQKKLVKAFGLTLVEIVVKGHGYDVKSNDVVTTEWLNDTVSDVRLFLAQVNNLN